MCGIWARTRFENKVAAEELLYPIASLRHRGPDGYGWYADDHAALVHTRLSIIDLAGGSQPLLSSNKRWIGVVNGELYDYEKLRVDLQKSGVQFHTQSDSEVLMQLFIERGPEGLAEVSGEFAFIFYDTLEKKIYFGRDPSGVKPLFLEMRSDSFTLASEMKALHDEKPVFDPIYFNTFLARTMVPPRTALANVQHVWPGQVHCLDLQTKKTSSVIYQRLALFQERNLSTEDAKDQLETELLGAVRRRLRADVEVGCYLSGGIDSSLIAAMAASLGAKPRAFTVGFSDRDFDESNEAAHVAQDLGIEHSVVQLTSKNFMGSLVQSIVAFENPITNPHGAAKNLLSAFASQSVKVVLSGEGSDEWLGGYAYMRIQKIKDFASRHPRLGAKAMQQFLEREQGMSLNHLDGTSDTFSGVSADYFNGKSPALLGRLTKKRLFRYITGLKMTPLIRDLCMDLSGRLRQENFGFQFSEMDLNLWTGARTDLLHYILANVGDRQEMAHSLEGRTPFLDTKLMRVIARVQEKDLIRALTEKYILRKVGAKYLQSLHQERGKKPFFAPMKYFYLRENREVVQQYLDIARRETPFLAWDRIDHLLSSSKRKTNSVLEGSIVTLRMALFSLGVLAQNLRAPNDDLQLQQRAYAIPNSVQQILSFRKGASHAF